MSANQAELGRGTNLLTADRADVTVSLLALGLGLSLRHDTSEADAQVNASLSELSLKGVGRRGMRVTVGAVVLDDQVAALTLSLEGLVVVAAILAGVSDLVFGAEEVDHLMQQGRAGGFLRAVDELGAEVDLIHALILGLPDLLGGAIAGFATVADPEAIVIGGGVSKAGQPLIDCIEKYYQRYAFPSCKETPIVLATLGNDAGIYGAAKMVL